MLVAYLYGDIGSAERAAFDAHCEVRALPHRNLRSCAVSAPVGPVRRRPSGARACARFTAARRIPARACGSHCSDSGVGAGCGGWCFSGGGRSRESRRALRARGLTVRTGWSRSGGATGPRRVRRQAHRRTPGGRRAGGSRKRRSWGGIRGARTSARTEFRVSGSQPAAGEPANRVCGSQLPRATGNAAAGARVAGGKRTQAAAGARAARRASHPRRERTT